MRLRARSPRWESQMTTRSPASMIHVSLTRSAAIGRPPTAGNGEAIMITLLLVLFSAHCLANQSTDASSPAPTYMIEITGKGGADDITFVDGTRLAWTTNE